MLSIAKYVFFHGSLQMKERPGLAPGIDAWLRSDLFGEKLLSIQHDLCRVTLQGGQEKTSVGWKLITLALSSGENDGDLILKALFNNVFTFKKCPYMLSVSLIKCKNEALKKLHLKSTIKCFKEVKIDK